MSFFSAWHSMCKGPGVGTAVGRDCRFKAGSQGARPAWEQTSMPARCPLTSLCLGILVCKVETPRFPLHRGFVRTDDDACDVTHSESTHSNRFTNVRCGCGYYRDKAGLGPGRSRRDAQGAQCKKTSLSRCVGLGSAPESVACLCPVPRRALLSGLSGLY